MGGSRAKERRQLERLEKQKEYHRHHGRGQFQAPDPELVKKNANNNGSFDVYHEDGDKPISPTPKEDGNTSKQGKVKKPKHLKRKLLSLNPEQQQQNDIETAESASSKEMKERERILDELKKWESQKVAHRQTKNPSSQMQQQHDDKNNKNKGSGQMETSSTRRSSLNPKKQSLPFKAPAAASMIQNDFARNQQAKSNVKIAASNSSKTNSEIKKRSMAPSPTVSSPGVRQLVVSSSSSTKKHDKDKVVSTTTRAKTESLTATTANLTGKSSLSHVRNDDFSKITSMPVPTDTDKEGERADDQEARSGSGRFALNTSPPNGNDEARAEKASHKRSANEVDDNDDVDGDDDNMLMGDGEKRQRGKRRRGRKDTSKNVPKEEDERQDAQEKDEMEKQHEDYDPKENDVAATDADAAALEEKEKKRQRKENDDRYCIGRKPVTDFIIGQTYPGKIVYIKPFGVFFDLGCHKDAFCHVSRLQDDFVESPESLFQVGDVVENCRVVEIDRKEQRITVSLQSLARIQDERASVEARKGRQSKRKKPSSSKSFVHQDRPQKQNKRSPDLIKKDVTSAEPPSASVVVTAKVAVKNSTGMNPHASIPNKPPLLPPPPRMGQGGQVGGGGGGSQQAAVGLTPAEEKRARKLARRAARREEKVTPE